MAKYNKVYLVNFGAKLTDDVLDAIKTEVDADEAEQVIRKVNLDLSKNPYLQCHDIVMSVKDILLGEDPFVINVPGLPVACIFIVNEITAIVGHEPTIVFTSRNIAGEGFFTDFKFRRLFNLNYEKTVTREKFKNGQG